MDNNIDNTNNVDNTSNVNVANNVNTNVNPVVNTNTDNSENMQPSQTSTPVVEKPKSYININNLTSRNNGMSKNAANATALDKLDDMSEERRAYVLEKEAIIKKRNKRRKAIIKNTIIFLVVFVCLYGYQYYFRPVEIDERIDKNSIHYLTDLYYSDGRYYEEFLDEKGKKVYLEIFNGLKDVKTSFIVDCSLYGYEDKISCGDDVAVSLELILLEHPDMFWYRYSSYKYIENKGVEIVPKYVTTNKVKLYFVEKRLLRKMDSVAKEYEDLSDYEKIKGIYTWLGANKSYSDGIIRTRKDGTAWSALLDDDTVCAGYAAASQLLFQRLDVKSTVVTGNTTGPHAWNFVFLDDGYYWYDATVGGSVGKDSPYFYNGLLFKDSGSYSVDLFDDEHFYWGDKYLES